MRITLQKAHQSILYSPSEAQSLPLTHVDMIRYFSKFVLLSKKQIWGMSLLLDWFISISAI